MAGAAGECVSTPDCWGERSVVVRKCPHVENLTGLLEVKSPTSELPTAAKSVMPCRSMGVVSCLGSSEPADCQSHEAGNCTDVTVSVYKEHMQVVNSCNAQEEIHMDQEAVPATMNKSSLQVDGKELSQDIQMPTTVLVWIDGVRFRVVQTTICCYWSTEESRDRHAEKKPMGDVGLWLGAGL